MESRKNRYTKKVILESLGDLIRKKPLAKITVTELCDLADINRSTFYRYYEDVYDVIQKSEEILYNDLLKVSISGLHLSEKMGSISPLLIRNCLKTIFKNKDLYLLLITSNHSNLQTRLMNDTKEFLNKEYSSMEGVDYPYASFAYSYMVSGCISIMQDWIKDNCMEPIEIIEEVILELVDSTCFLIWHPKNDILSNKLK